MDRLDPELLAAVADLTRAATNAAGIRPNELLDSFMSAPPPAPSAEPEPPRDLRANPALDELFGVAAPPPVAQRTGPVDPTQPRNILPPPTPAPPDLYGFAPERSAGRDAPIPLADPTRRPVEDREGYGLLPPPPPPPPGSATGSPFYDPTRPLPPTAGPSGSNAGGPGRTGDDLTRWVRECRDGINKLVQQSTRATGAGASGVADPTAGQEKGYGLGDALRPVTNWLGNSKVGQIAGRAWGRLPPSVRRGIARKGKQLLNGSKAGRWLQENWKPRANPTGGAAAGAGAPSGGAAGGTAARAGAAGARAAGVAGTEAAAGGAAAGGAAAGGAAVGAEGALAASAAAGPAAPIVAGVVVATAALYELAKAGKDLAYQQEGRARELAEVSGAQAGQVAQLDASRTMRAVESGQNTAQTSGQLTESIDRFENATRPLTDAVDNVSNVIGAKVLDHLSTIAQFIEPLADAATWLAKKVPGYREPEKDEAFGEQLARMGKDIEERAAGARRAAADAGDALRRLR